MTIHTLKCWPEYFKALKDGSKTFEVRIDDRNFQAEDILILREWDVERKIYTGPRLMAMVATVFKNVPGLLDGYCAMQLKNINPWRPNDD